LDTNPAGLDLDLAKPDFLVRNLFGVPTPKRLDSDLLSLRAIQGFARRLSIGAAVYSVIAVICCDMFEKFAEVLLMIASVFALAILF
jgi:hypothetical protein